MAQIPAAALLTDIIRPTLHVIGFDSPAAEELLLGTACQESACGLYREQIHGPALGVWQMEPATALDIWMNYLAYRPALRTEIDRLLGNGDRILALRSNDPYACAMARIEYLRASEPLPPAGDVAAQAAYYCRFYNRGGKATPEEYAANWRAMSPVAMA